jgi:predicted SAM-dependent methyltransferase
VIKLNLGCGHLQIDGFTNIDADPAVEPDVVCDVSNLDSLYPDGSVDSIVAYDVIEHFDRFQYARVLEHWFKKLAPSGTLLLRTNDWDRLIYHYLTGKLLKSRILVDFEKLVWHLMCEHEKPGMGHKWGFNRETMAAALTAAGFSGQSFIHEARLTIGDYPHACGPDFNNFVVLAVK